VLQRCWLAHAGESGSDEGLVFLIWRPISWCSKIPFCYTCSIYQFYKFREHCKACMVRIIIYTLQFPGPDRKWASIVTAQKLSHHKIYSYVFLWYYVFYNHKPFGFSVIKDRILIKIRVCIVQLFEPYSTKYSTFFA